MVAEMRGTGIPFLGDLPWGAHICLFFETQSDLQDAFVPFLRAGLDTNEACILVTSPPLTEQAAVTVLRAGMPQFDQQLAAGWIEVDSYEEWYLRNGVFDASALSERWDRSLNRAMEGGRAGLRMFGDVSWLTDDARTAFAEYELGLDQWIARKPLLFLCAYPLTETKGTQVFDVARAHQVALARRRGTWQVLETPELIRAREEIQKLNEDLERRVVERTKDLAEANDELRKEIIERQRAEELARLNEARYRAVIESQTEFIVRWKPGGTRTFANQSYRRFFGLTPEEAVSGSFLPLIAEEDRPAVLEKLSRLTSGEVLVATDIHRVLRADGSFGGWQEWVDKAILDEAGQVVEFQSVGRDVTDRMRAEEDLKKSEAKLQDAQRIAKIGYWERDVIADRITCSEVTADIFGVPLGSTRTQAELQQMIHPEDRPVQQQALIEALNGGPAYDVEYRIIRPDGGIRFVHVRDQIVRDERDRPTRLFGTVQDVTELRQAEKELRRHAARMEVLAQASRSLEEAGLDYERLLSTVARRTAELIGDASVVTLFSDDRQRAYPVAFHHPNPQALAMMHEALLHTWAGGTDTARYAALLAGESVFIPEVDPQVFKAGLEPEFHAFMEAFGISSVLIVPLRLSGQAIGSLGLTRDRGGSQYTHDDLLLMQSLADGAALAIQNVRLFQSVNEQRERLRALSASLVKAQEEERRRIARELHDEAGQLLTGLQIALEMDSRSAASPHSHLSDAQETVGQLIDQIQNLSLELRPRALDDLGLVPALLEHFERYTRQTGIRVRFEHRGADRRFPPEVETTAYRVIQEGLTNAARHADVAEVGVHAWVEAGTLGVQIEDEGKGFEVQATIAAHATAGLRGMQERAALLGGQLTIESALGQGTQVTVELPIVPGRPPDHDEDVDSARR